MLSLQDKKILSNMIREYGVNLMIRELANAVSDQADQFSDLALKDKAIEYSEMADILRNLLVE